MKIEEIIKFKDINIYKKLMNMFSMREMNKQKNEIELGDSIKNLMQHDGYKRIGRRIRQTKWG